MPIPISAASWLICLHHWILNLQLICCAVFCPLRGVKWPGFPLGVKIKSAPKCQALLKFPTQFPLSTPWQLSDTHTDTLAPHMHVHSYTLMGTCQFDLLFRLFPWLLFLFCSFYALFCLQETEIVRLNRQFAFPVPLMSWIHPPSVRTIAQIRTWVPPWLLMLLLFLHGWNRITIIIIFNISMASQILLFYFQLLRGIRGYKILQSLPQTATIQSHAGR